jgi:outer membrane protein OmpA-like peptidoglycan-associated protein
MRSFALLFALAVPALASAQSGIDEVLVYPGGAQVTRLASVAAGARELVLNCLTARFDPDSLQIEAPAGVSLGPVQLETLPRERLPECANSPRDEQIRKLEGQRDQLAAESSALEASLSYLKALGSGEARGTPAAGIAGTADSIRKAAQDALLRQAQLRRQLEDLDRQITPLKGERDRLAEANPQWRSLRLRLPSEVMFAYDSANISPGFAPTLREVARLMERYPRTEARIVGHTDSAGSDSYNLDLSLRRADSVAAFLSNQGVSSRRLLTEGRGEQDPIASNATPQGQQMNRRVDIILRRGAHKQ